MESAPPATPVTAQTLVHEPSPSIGSGPCRLVTHVAPTLPSSENEVRHVLVRFLAAPVNRVDLMTLANQYPTKPLYTEAGGPIPGFDGVATVMASSSPLLPPGTLVIPRDLGLGTWRTHATLPAHALIRLPPGTPPLAAALLRSGATVAWLLLEAIPAAPTLKPGDWILVSAGTSIVAQVLAQLARRKGLNTILIVRDREASALAAVKEKLLCMGAAAVMTESELHEAVAAGQDGPFPGRKPVLALDSVFGRVGQDMAAALAPRGKFVLVGLLAGPAASITVTTQHLFARQISFLPFRSSEVLKQMGDAAVEELLGKLATMFIDGALKTPEVKVVDWTRARPGHVEDALRQAVEAAKSTEPGHVKNCLAFLVI